jgi:hypothetical protein
VENGKWSRAEEKGKEEQNIVSLVEDKQRRGMWRSK